ncbi:adenosylcobinamide-GDP ribazoletransferase [Candidatus Poribacteria bacterium]|nr:adenosylcobinamide-GDP ribazoletransferase [Candidatus Poribacteria bacterium]
MGYLKPGVKRRTISKFKMAFRISKEALRILDEIRLTISFLSRIPIGGNGEIERIPTHFPIVGYLCAGSYIGIRYLLGLISPQIAVLSSMAVTFYLFNLFHFDGLLDTLDGFLNQSGREKRLEIMSRGDVGPFALFFGTLYVLALYSILLDAEVSQILVACVISRFSMNLLLGLSRPAKMEGLGAAFYPYRWRNALIASAYLIPLLILYPVFVLTGFILSGLIAMILSRISRHKIGGTTGDVLGAFCLLSELGIMISISVFSSAPP